MADGAAGRHGVGVGSDGLLRAATPVRLGDRGALIVAGLLAALALGVAAIVAGRAPGWHASTGVTSREIATPSPASMAASRGVGSDQRAFWIARSRGGLVAVNSAQRLRAAFTADGVRVSVPGGSVGLLLLAVGRGGSLQPEVRVRPIARVNRVSYSRGKLQEWYANGPLGLEQGVTLRARPSGASSNGGLSLSYALTGGIARLRGGQLTFSASNGVAILRYSGLIVTDARGKVLPSHLQLNGARLLIYVNDRGARYPVTVDPLMQAATLTASDPAQGNQFGVDVAVSGTTLVVGDPEADPNPNSNLGDEGAAYVFTEPASGWANATQTAKLIASSGSQSEKLGDAVAVS
jgi:hypothetical protein